MQSIPGIFVASVLIVVILFSAKTNETLKAHIKQLMDVTKVSVFASVVTEHPFPCRPEVSNCFFFCLLLLLCMFIYC